MCIRVGILFFLLTLSVFYYFCSVPRKHQRDIQQKRALYQVFFNQITLTSLSDLKNEISSSHVPRLEYLFCISIKSKEETGRYETLGMEGRWEGRVKRQTLFFSLRVCRIFFSFSCVHSAAWCSPFHPIPTVRFLLSFPYSHHSPDHNSPHPIPPLQLRVKIGSTPHFNSIMCMDAQWLCCVCQLVGWTFFSLLFPIHLPPIMNSG
ncbi:MAG: hypothetical protein J3R72DRAFT_218390 [Linnemannia gamsii]|nr:MAG: hypothetical protein J3R72DRAFT_218390 [Linnemannia gamsii]